MNHDSIETPAIFPLLRVGFYHFTSLDGLRNILTRGAIVPNDGDLPNTSSVSPVSYGRRRGYISLFDFETPTEAECMKHCWGKWSSILTAHDPVSIGLRLDRVALRGHIITNEEIARETEYREMFIPKVEVCSKVSVPVSAITSYLVVCQVDLGTFKQLSVADDIIDRIEEVVREFRRLHANEYAQRERWRVIHGGGG